jgi:CDP-glucose 4,6-dehydratase
MDLNFWQGKKVFITGHTGFKGSWLTMYLLSKGAEITGYSLPAPTEPSMFDLCNLGSRIHNITADVNNLSDLKQAIKGHDIVFHMAAQALVLESYKAPVHTYQTNVMGTANLLEACRDENIKSIVCVTSDKCYENKEWVWGYRENDDLGGIDPYSSSKACAEIIVNTYRTAYNLNVASCRAGNVIGGGDWGAYRLIPNIIRCTENNETMIVRKPKATRPWQHVVEPIAGYALLAEKLYNDGLEWGRDFAQAWNFGPTSVIDVPVIEIVKILKSYFNFEHKVKISENDPHEARNLKLDCFKALHELGWCIKWNTQEALEKTAIWYQNYFESKKPQNYSIDLFEISIRQIKEYEDTLRK